MHFVLKLAFSHPKLEPRYLSKLIDTKHIFIIGGDETKKIGVVLGRNYKDKWMKRCVML